MTTLTEFSAVELADMIDSKAVSCLEVMSAYLARIDQLNGELNAIIALRDGDELLAEAAACDNRPSRGWLHGMPFAVKDLENVNGLPTTQGSRIFVDFFPEEDGRLASRLRKAGAIFIGKTNTPEFGLGSQTYNEVHGPTRNPFDTRLTAGGSSGGAAAALAARMLPVADGSDMMGSLRNPASFNGIYALRPSYGLVPPDSNLGDLFLHQLATSGPMGRTIRDLAHLLETIAGPTPCFPHAMGSMSFSSAIELELPEARLGWIGDWGGYYPVEGGILDVSEAALSAFSRLGYEFEQVLPKFNPQRLWTSWNILRSWAIASKLAPLHADKSKRALMKPEAIWEIEAGLKLSATDVHEASLIRSDWYRTLSCLFETYDALVLPSAQILPFDVRTNWPSSVANHAMPTYHKWMEIVIPASIVGLPTLAVPAGITSSGLPVGIQLIGARGTDSRLLRIGQRYHEVTDWPAMARPRC